MWEGPLRIEASGAACEADLSLVTAVYAEPVSRLVIVTSHSGSLTHVYFLDALSCAERRPAVRTLSEGVEVAGRRIRILPGCECGEPGLPCDCCAAHVFDLDEQSRPLLNEEASSDLTAEVLGVAFQGSRKVLGPRSPDARLVN
jgi:hypothetical protein